MAYLCHVMLSTQLLFSDVLRMLYPHNCPGCGEPIILPAHYLCPYCIAALPETGFWRVKENRLLQQFWGRLLLQQAQAFIYFQEKSIPAILLKRLKYRGETGIAAFLGRLFAEALCRTDSCFIIPDGIVPLPLHPRRLRQRGYNQSLLLARAMAEVWQIPVWSDAVVRSRYALSQTTRSRWQRWQNVSGLFSVKQPALLSGRHVLLLDDVITTGSTMESCGRCMLNVPGTTLSVAAIATATRFV